ncbi:MAG: substrate-binding domain-containing protein [Polyangiales bacterium]
MTAKRLLRLLAAAVLVWAVVLLLACKKKASSSGHAGTDQDPWVIGVSQCNLGEPWRVQMNEDLAAAAKSHPNLKLVFKDAQNDSLTQRAQVGELVSQDIDLLIVSPKEASPLTKPVAEAFQKGIPVIVLDRQVEGQEFTTFIGGDNKKIGREAGKWIAKALGAGGKLVEIEGLMTSTPASDRHDGFLEGLGNSGANQIVFTADMQWLEPNARKEMDSALTTNAQIDLVYAHNDPGAHGAWLAAKAAKREGIKFVGIDALPHEGVQYVKDGILDATFTYPTGGTEAIETAIKLLAKQQVPKQITLGTRLWTKQNVAQGGEAIP